jgi:hypothetical protein
MSDISRRSLTALVASLPALAIPAIAVAAASEPDPILAAIEEHRQALLLRFAKGRVTSPMRYDDPNHAAAREDEGTAVERLDDAEWELAITVPTTLAGVIALLRYVRSHHHQEIALPEEPRHWYSQAEFFGSFEDEEVRDHYNGEPVDFPLTFWIMRNVLEALEAVRS